ncbi:MAG: hypothetical protein AB4050_17120 [Synechococcus sp.]
MVGLSLFLGVGIATIIRRALILAFSWPQPSSLVVFGVTFFVAYSFNAFNKRALLDFFGTEGAAGALNRLTCALAIAVEVGFLLPGAMHLMANLGVHPAIELTGTIGMVALSATTVLFWAQGVGPRLKEWRNRHSITREDLERERAEQQREREERAAEFESHCSQWRKATEQLAHARQEEKTLGKKYKTDDALYQEAKSTWLSRVQRLVQMHAANMNQHHLSPVPQTPRLPESTNGHRSGDDVVIR